MRGVSGGAGRERQQNKKQYNCRYRDDQRKKHALRAQADKQEYQNRMRRALMTQPRLTVRQSEAVSIETDNGRVCAVTTSTGARLSCLKAIVATGVLRLFKPSRV